MIVFFKGGYLVITDKFIDVQILESELKNMQEIAEGFELKFSNLSQMIAYIFDKIKMCRTLHEAEEYFSILEKIQGCLACLLFRYEIGMHERLERFVRDFDNFEASKDYYFEKIISGEYSY